MTPSGPAHHTEQSHPNTPHVAAWTGGQPVDNQVTGQVLATSGLMLGHGAFTTLLINSSSALARDRHISRLTHDVERLELPAVQPHHVAAAIRSAQDALPDISGRYHRLRLIWTTDHHSQGLLVATTHPAPNYDTHRARVWIADQPWSRPHVHRGVKSCAYADHLLTLLKAKADDYDEAIWLDHDGNVVEGTTSNVIVDMGNSLATPPTSTGLLPGITRQILLDYSSQWDIPLIERMIHRDELRACRGAALTSSLRGVQEICAINGHALAKSTILGQLQNHYQNLTQSLPENV